MKDISHKEKKPTKISPTKHKKTLSANIQSPQKGPQNVIKKTVPYKDTENFAHYQSAIINQYVENVENKHYESEDRVSKQKPLAFNIINYESSAVEERKNMESIGLSPSFNSKSMKFDSQKEQYSSNYESIDKNNEIEEMYIIFLYL